MRALMARVEKVAHEVVGATGGGGASHARVTLAEELTHGDVALNHALVLARALKKPPQEVAKTLAHAIQASLGEEANVSVAAPGFVNITLSPRTLVALEKEAILQPQAWGKGAVRAGQRVVVEYTQPNPFKAFHIGHLMSNSIGEAISRLVAAQGARVVRANYQGDVGPHVAKAVWALWRFPQEYDPRDAESLGQAYARGARAYEEDATAREEIDAINRRLYALLGGEAPASEKDRLWLELYHTGREASLEHFARIYALLGTTFDEFFFESEAAPIGAGVVREGLARGIFAQSEGAVVFRGEEHCNPPLHTRVFLTRHGTPTYEAKELGLVELKRRRLGEFDENITTVAVEQESYGKLLACAIGLLWPELAGKYQFVAHGMLQLTSGKMSSRTGKVITGESLLADLRARAREMMQGRVVPEEVESTADAVAVAAVRFAVLRQNRGKNIRFDPQASLSLSGDSGPYLQYTHARLASLFAKARDAGFLSGEEEQEARKLSEALSLEGLSPHALAVARLVARFPVVVDRAHEELEPSHLAHYLLSLAGLVNRWYEEEQIVRDSKEATLPRLAHLASVKATLKRGLELLGIRPLEAM
ncbi:MAG: arginine--tRNA ligase [Candidatus Parcubacteria bacterium]|nr:MAG: arginine--tRNA ligase [Candidatus Parcubacteria bacterium]